MNIDVALMLLLTRVPALFWFTRYMGEIRDIYGLSSLHFVIRRWDGLRDIYLYKYNEIMSLNLAANIFYDLFMRHYV